MLDVETLSPRQCRLWRELLTAAETGRLRRTETGQDMHDPPGGAIGVISGQPKLVAQPVAAGVRAGWLRLEALRYRRTPAGDVALDEIRARLDATVAVRQCR